LAIKLKVLILKAALNSMKCVQYSTSKLSGSSTRGFNHVDVTADELKKLLGDVCFNSLYCYIL